MAARSILIYVPALVGGGAERVAALLASGFAAAGRQTLLVTDFEAPENRGFVDPAVETVTLAGGGHAGDVGRLAALLRARRPSLALAIGSSPNLKLAAAALLSRSATPIVLSYHGRSEISRGLLGWLGYPLAPALARAAARVVCVSDSLASHLVKDWRVPARTVLRIHNPVPIGLARPAASEAELMARPPVVLAVGRFVPEKGFDVLIEAMARLPREVGLRLVGGGPEEAALRDLARRRGVAERVSFEPYATDPWPLYTGARCLAAPSRSEAFGNVVVEALASGLPVVAADSGGPREILEDGLHGAIVPQDRPDLLAEALDWALRAPGDPAPRRARAAAFDTHRVAADYLALFDVIAADGEGLVHDARPSAMGAQGV